MTKEEILQKIEAGEFIYVGKDEFRHKLKINGENVDVYKSPKMAFYCISVDISDDAFNNIEILGRRFEKEEKIREIERLKKEVEEME